MQISETFLSIQGEGPSAGTPAHFLRLQGCDVGCHWCDTKYSWDADGGRDVDEAELWAGLERLGSAPLLVITGGEPLQHPDLDRVLDRALERWPRVEIETSGILPPPRSHPHLFFNVSPKLPSATPRWSETWRHTEAWIAEPGATFKIVVGDPPDPDDLVRLVEERRLPRERLLLMPEGLTDQALKARAATLAALCTRLGARLSPRLHVWIWGARRGV